MGTETLSDKTNGNTIDQTWFNLIHAVLSGSLVPRNASRVPEAIIGSLGTNLLPWLKAYIASGYFSCGDVKLHHSYNSLTGPGHGWMLCDGRQVTKANYETEHGEDTWDTYIISSPLEDLYLPDMDDKFPLGVDATTQSGAVAITATGNANHQIDIQHRHKWYDQNGETDRSYDVNGDYQNIASSSDTGIGISALDGGGLTSYSHLSLDYYTSHIITNIINIKPYSIQFQFYMRII